MTSKMPRLLLTFTPLLVFFTSNRFKVNFDAVKEIPPELADGLSKKLLGSAVGEKHQPRRSACFFFGTPTRAKIIIGIRLIPRNN